MWYTESGVDGDVVVSSRVRLARNIKGIPFPARANKEQQEAVLSQCKKAVSDNEKGPRIAMHYIDLSAMKDYEKQAIAERHLISPQMMDDRVKRGLLLSDNNEISVLLNEEDHLRIQAMAAGFDIDRCFNQVNLVDDLIEESVEYAFDEKLGYLTCCPTNVGTGMRASVMVHLPGLSISGRVNQVIDSLAQLGFTVRGIFGEGSKSSGHLYQISNQLTLGAAEEDILERFKQIIAEVIDKERAMRTRLYGAERFKLEDRLLRSYGILKHAVILTSEEAMKRLSDVRFAVELGLIPTMKLQTINAITYEILPGNIRQRYNISDVGERDLKRAEIVKERMCEGC